MVTVEASVTTDDGIGAPPPQPVAQRVESVTPDTESARRFGTVAAP